MTKSDAERRVKALRQVTTARGATPAEAEVAEAKALALVERWGLGQSYPYIPPLRSYRPRPRASRRRRSPSGHPPGFTFADLVAQYDRYRDQGFTDGQTRLRRTFDGDYVYVVEGHER